jgi:DNA-directed RNA polymerase subunit RPC12/RpoP
MEAQTTHRAKVMNQTDPLDARMKEILVEFYYSAHPNVPVIETLKVERACAAINAEIAKAEIKMHDEMLDYCNKTCDFEVREASKRQNYYCDNCGRKLLLMDLEPKLEEDGCGICGDNGHTAIACPNKAAIKRRQG